MPRSSLDWVAKHAALLKQQRREGMEGLVADPPRGVIVPNPKQPRTIEEAAKDFWSQVRRSSESISTGQIISECWPWTGLLDEDGYGRFCVAGLFNLAHVFSFFLHYWIYPKDCFVCHTCDNPPCVNPRHLFLGDAKINKFDEVQKSRNAFGIRQGSAKLSESDVVDIRKAYGSGQATQRELAIQYGVTSYNIQSIVLRKTWKHL